MKKLILLTGLCLGAALTARAALTVTTYDSGFENGGNVLDGNVNPWSDTRTVSGIADSSIVSVSVTLNVSGGYNGDLFAYLSYNGTRVILLNRVGVGTGSNPVFAFGYSGAGFTGLVLQDGGVNGDIHTYDGGVGTGLYSADGRDISPLSNPTTLYAASRATLDGTFGGMNPNGDWTLVFADVSSGGGQSTVLNWGLNIQTVSMVPEAGTWIVGFLLAGLLGATEIRLLLRRRGVHHS